MRGFNLQAIANRMMAEDCAMVTDTEIERTLAPCVAGKSLVAFAKAHQDELAVIVGRGK